MNLGWGLEKIMNVAKSGGSVEQIKEFVINKAKKMADEDIEINKTLEKTVDIKDVNMLVDYMENNTFEADYRLLESNFFRSLYYGGFFGHNKITVEQVQKLLNENQDILDTISNEHINKLSKFVTHQ